MKDLSSSLIIIAGIVAMSSLLWSRRNQLGHIQEQLDNFLLTGKMGVDPAGAPQSPVHAIDSTASFINLLQRSNSPLCDKFMESNQLPKFQFDHAESMKREKNNDGVITRWYETDKTKCLKTSPGKLQVEMKILSCSEGAGALPTHTFSRVNAKGALVKRPCMNKCLQVAMNITIKSGKASLFSVHNALIKPKPGDHQAVDYSTWLKAASKKKNQVVFNMDQLYESFFERDVKECRKFWVGFGEDGQGQQKGLQLQKDANQNCDCDMAESPWKTEIKSKEVARRSQVAMQFDGEDRFKITSISLGLYATHFGVLGRKIRKFQKDYYFDYSRQWGVAFSRSEGALLQKSLAVRIAKAHQHRNISSQLVQTDQKQGKIWTQTELEESNMTPAKATTQSGSEDGQKEKSGAYPMALASHIPMVVAQLAVTFTAFQHI